MPKTLVKNVAVTGQFLAVPGQPHLPPLVTFKLQLTILRAIDDGNGLVGTIGSFTMQGDREITYWIDPARWGEGLATAALGVFLTVEATRPLFARVAEHNLGSAKVLARAKFVEIGSETSYADGLGRDVVEHIYRLAQ